MGRGAITTPDAAAGVTTGAHPFAILRPCDGLVGLNGLFESVAPWARSKFTSTPSV